MITISEHKGEAEVTQFQKNHTHEVAEHLQRDRFGFRKLLIASSYSGKVTALQTEGGSIVWSRFIPGCSNILDTVAFRQASHLVPQLAIICQVCLVISGTK